MITLPAPVEQTLVLPDGRHLRVVRDDLLPGGTKVRALVRMMEAGGTYVYAGPCEGYAQIALGRAAVLVGASGIAFVAKRRTPHSNTVQARLFGAKIVEIPHGYLTVVKARARAYCAESGATLLPFGIDTPVARAAIRSAAETIPAPVEAWCVAGSGTLARSLAAAWPGVTVNAVRVGMEPVVAPGVVVRHVAPEKFAQDAKLPPPFPSASNYDAKAWRFIVANARDGALFWNVGA